MAQPPAGGDGPRKRGRPRRDIDPDAVADAVATLFAEGGAEAVSIVDAAEKLNVSRATLYRSVPTREHLMGVLFERSTRELTEQAKAVLAEDKSPREHLEQLIRLQVDAAIRMRQYLPVFFGGGELPKDVFSRWHEFSQHFESLWVDVVAAAMRDGQLAADDPVITARLLLGQCNWVSRWYRDDDRYTSRAIADAAINLLLGPAGGRPCEAVNEATSGRPASTRRQSPR